MQEGRTVSPLGPVVLQREESDMRASLSLPSQERRPVLLVRTSESFPRYDNMRQQQSPPSSPILRSVTVEKDQYHDIDTQSREKRPNDEEEEEQDEEEEDEIEDERNASTRRNVVVDDEDDEEQEEEEEEESRSERHRNGNYHEDGDIEVDVCREDADESNPSSPVDLTAPSSRGVTSEQFVHPFTNRGVHSFTCVQSGGHGPVGHATPVYISGHSATGSTVMTVCTSGGVARTTTGTSTGSITTTATSTVQTNNKRCLAFSVENILDPNKFTGGRVVHNRVQQRRHRQAGSVHEGD